MANYYEAVQKILVRRDAMVPNPYPPFAQTIWNGGAAGTEDVCFIVLINRKSRVTDPFPIITVAHVAAVIARMCVTQEYGFLGGFASLGLLGSDVLVGGLQLEAKAT